MKSIWLPIVLFCTGCATLASDPWSWLDERPDQRWVDVKIEGYDCVITFSVPDRREGIRERPRIWPPFARNQSVQEINVSSEALAEPSNTLGQYIWDRWWGGFTKGSGFDFSLNVRVDREPSDQNLLALGVPERLDRPVTFRKALYSGSDSVSKKFADYFFARFWVKPFESEAGDIWIMQNNPAVTADHVNYTIPISDQHILEFSFFVRDKRYDWKDDPEWNARRWALVEEIMNTVRIDPAPFWSESAQKAVEHD